MPKKPRKRLMGYGALEGRYAGREMYLQLGTTFSHELDEILWHDKEEIRVCWQRHKDEIMERWREKHPDNVMPWAWFEFENQ
jgi:hypothetical protein